MVTDPIYSGSKHFLVGFVRSVAPQLAERGITINAVCPAVVDTPMVATVRDEVLAAGIPLIRPEEIAEAVLGAARDGSTGQCWACLPRRAPVKHEFPLFFRSA
jgi:NAD(P)-dependent dehydrogenase (short-subunit alcohol dehydrogenase family)